MIRVSLSDGGYETETTTPNSPKVPSIEAKMARRSKRAANALLEGKGLGSLTAFHRITTIGLHRVVVFSFCVVVFRFRGWGVVVLCAAAGSTGSSMTGFLTGSITVTTSTITGHQG